MDFGMRIIFINEDDTFKKIPAARFDRFMNKDPKAAFPEYKNSRIRCAELFLKLENKVPVGIAQASYSYLQFDAKGGLDQAFADEMGQVIAQMMAGFPLPDDPENLIRASDRIAQKRFQEKFTWTPSHELEQALFKEAFK